MLDSMKEWKGRGLLGDWLQKARLQIFWEVGLRGFKAVKKLELFASRPIGDKRLQLYSAQQCCTRLSARMNCCWMLNCWLTCHLPRATSVFVLDSSMKKSFVSLSDSVSAYYILLGIRSLGEQESN